MRATLTRLTKEIDDELSILQQPINVEYDYVNKTITVIIQNKKFVLSDTYPFKNPDVFILDPSSAQYSPYTKFLKPPTQRIYQLLNKHRYNCLCCNTILIGWSPAYRIIKLLDEIDNFNCIKRDIKYRIALQELGKKHNIIEQVSRYIMEYL